MPSKINTKKFNNQQKEYELNNIKLQLWQHLYDHIKLVNKINNNDLINIHRRFISKKTGSGLNLNNTKLKSLVLLKELCNTKSNYDLKRDSVVRTIENKIKTFNKLTNTE